MDVRVREAIPGDAVAIRDVHVAAVELARGTYEDEVVDAWSHDRDPSDYAIESPDASIVVAERTDALETDEAIVGFGELRFEAGGYLDDVEGEIRAVYVHPDAARAGVGSAIYSELEGRARERSLGSLGLWASLNAVPFYETLGFERVTERTHEFGGEVEAPAMEMQKELG